MRRIEIARYHLEWKELPTTGYTVCSYLRNSRYRTGWKVCTDINPAVDIHGLNKISTALIRFMELAKDLQCVAP